MLIVIGGCTKIIEKKAGVIIFVAVHKTLWQFFIISRLMTSTDPK